MSSSRVVRRRRPKTENLPVHVTNALSLYRMKKRCIGDVTVLISLSSESGRMNRIKKQLNDTIEDSESIHGSYVRWSLSLTKVLKPQQFKDRVLPTFLYMKSDSSPTLWRR